MSIQLPPIDARSLARRETAARIQQDRIPVQAITWPGERHMARWTWVDALINSDVIPVACAVFAVLLIVWR